MGRYIARSLITDGSATGEAQPWNGGRGAFMVEGTFAGATVKLQYKTPNGTWIDVDATNAAFTAAGMCVFECPPGDIRAAVSSGSPSGFYAYVITTDDV
jgi:hypothetical protein